MINKKLEIIFKKILKGDEEHIGHVISSEKKYLIFRKEEGDNVHFYLVDPADKKVSVSNMSIHFDKNAAKLYDVETLPEYRRLGMARFLSSLAYNEAKNKNVKVINARSSPDGESFYKNSGFGPREKERNLNVFARNVSQKYIPRAKVITFAERAKKLRR